MRDMAQEPVSIAINRLAASSATWLVQAQRDDGSWPLYFDPRDKSEGPFDFIRSAVAAQGLATYASAGKNSQANTAARKAFLFLYTTLVTERKKSQVEGSLLLECIYLGEIARALGEITTAQSLFAPLFPDILEHEPDAHLYGQALFLAHSLPLHVTVDTVERLEMSLMEACIHAAHQDRISAAFWMEPLRGLLGTSFEANALQLTDRVVGEQLHDGAFPAFLGDDEQSAYTRGTAKVLEICTLKPERYAAVINGALRWLSSMQYADGVLAGGFKHDHANPQAWIDANGHLLIGLSSLLSAGPLNWDKHISSAKVQCRTNEIKQPLRLYNLFSAIYRARSRFEIPTPTLAVMRRLVGTQTGLPVYWELLAASLQQQGIAENFRLLLPQDDEAQIAGARVRGLWDETSDGNKPELEIAGGTSVHTPDEAISTAFGECLERIPFTRYRRQDMRFASVLDLQNSGESYLSPYDIGKFSPEQHATIPELLFDNRSMFSWVTTKRLHDGTPVLLPAQLIFWNYNRTLSGRVEPCLRESSTHGGGGHFTETRALLSGIYEWVQRDGFFIHWLNNHAPKKIDCSDTKDIDLSYLLSECRRLDIEAFFLDTTSEIDIPSAVCVLIDRRLGYPAVVVGSGCGPDSNQTLRRALLEALSIHYWALRETPLPPSTSFISELFKNRKLSARTRLRLWSRKEMIPFIGPFISGTEESLAEFNAKEKVYPNEETEYRAILETLQTFGRDFSVYAYEATHPALQAVGFHAAKTFIPGLFPLYYMEGNAPLAHPRLKNGPKALGFEALEQPYSVPHPFP